ncbi:NUDIX hydrolase [Synechococcus sp. PCC 6717]|nr:NUDIX hydrolase [Synechococcus sp. PCC 6717]
MAASPLIQVSLAILYQGDRVLMQLRDDVATILYPGHWGLFGGHLEAGETPEMGVVREVYEEIGYRLPECRFFGDYVDPYARRSVFVAPLTCGLDALDLQEGQGMDLVPYASVVQGVHFATTLGEPRPLGSMHQRILLDFFHQ